MHPSRINNHGITAESSSAVKVFKQDAENKNKRKNTLKCVQKELKKMI